MLKSLNWFLLDTRHAAVGCCSLFANGAWQSANGLLSLLHILAMDGFWCLALNSHTPNLYDCMCTCAGNVSAGPLFLFLSSTLWCDDDVFIFNIWAHMCDLCVRECVTTCLGHKFSPASGPRCVGFDPGSGEKIRDEDESPKTRRQTVAHSWWWLPADTKRLHPYLDPRSCTASSLTTKSHAASGTNSSWWQPSMVATPQLWTCTESFFAKIKSYLNVLSFQT